MSTFIIHKSNISEFDKFRFNKYSQNGEDGVIKEILNRLIIGEKYHELMLVEFGAWDGIYLSNTFRLVEKGAKALYIEGTKSRFEILKNTARKYSNIIPVHAYVSDSPHSENSLEELLKRNNVIQNFDILSIDVDGLDLEIFKNIGNFQPKIVIIEIVSEYGKELYNHEIENKIGSTFRSTVEYFESKNYKLVCHIGNLIFVHKNYFNKVCRRINSDSGHLFNPYWNNVNYYLRISDYCLAFIIKWLYYFLPHQAWGKLRQFLRI